MTILIFLAVLFVLILVHEWGHFIVAKKTGMRVDEFGIGFPPKLFGIKKGETEYTINALPIGGFVKIYGEDSEADSVSTDATRSFTAKSKWAQVAVLLAGVTMNIIFAWLLFVLVYTIGVPTAIEESKATPEAKLLVSSVLPDGPAAEADVPVGARVISLSRGSDSLTTFTPSAFSSFVSSSEGAEILLEYQSGAATQFATLTPQRGVVDSKPDQFAIGVAMALVDTVSMPLPTAVIRASVETVSGLGMIVVGLAGLLTDSVLGQADLSQVAGPVGLVGLVGDAAGFGFASLLLFTAFISLNLAVINLVPFPALDGGRVVMVAIEAIIRRPINPVWVMRVNLAGFALLILFMLLVTYSDVTKLL